MPYFDGVIWGKTSWLVKNIFQEDSQQTDKLLEPSRPKKTSILISILYYTYQTTNRPQKQQCSNTFSTPNSLFTLLKTYRETQPFPFKVNQQNTYWEYIYKENFHWYCSSDGKRFTYSTIYHRISSR